MLRLRSRWRRGVLAAMVCLLTTSAVAHAQDPSDDLRKLAHNPFADVFSIALEEDLFQETGPYDREASSFTIEPLIPCPIGDNWLLVVRATTTAYSFSPDVDSTHGSETGFGDFAPAFFFGRSRVRRIIVGAGPAFLLPTATHGVGSGRWAVGPALAVVFQPDWGTASVVSQALWSVAGDPSRSAVRQLEIDLTVSRNLPRGWYVGSAPVITNDWTAQRGQRWVVPLGVMSGWSGRIRRQAIDWNVGVYRMSVRPMDTSIWEATLQFTLLYPKRNRAPQARAPRRRDFHG